MRREKSKGEKKIKEKKNRMKHDKNKLFTSLFN
jgi:hypothetical protein